MVLSLLFIYYTDPYFCNSFIAQINDFITQMSCEQENTGFSLMYSSNPMGKYTILVVVTGCG